MEIHLVAISFLLTELPIPEIYPGLLPALKIGDPLLLNCKSNEATKIKWKRDGASELSRAKIHEKAGESVLSISEVEASDSGNYSCEAQNADGIRSAYVKINVLGKATRLTVFLIPYLNFKYWGYSISLLLMMMTMMMMILHLWRVLSMWVCSNALCNTVTMNERKFTDAANFTEKRSDHKNRGQSPTLCKHCCGLSDFPYR